MNPSVPPIPPPAPYYCHNCGAPLQEQVELCPHCGARQVPRSKGPNVWSVLGAIILGLIGGGLGLSGSCFLLFSLPGLSSGEFSTGAQGLVFAAVLLGGAALCLWGMIRLFKRR